MSEFGSMHLVYLIGAVVLAGSALVGYRLSWKRGLTYALMWGAIFAVVFLVIGAVAGK